MKTFRDLYKLCADLEQKGEDATRLGLLVYRGHRQVNILNSVTDGNSVLNILFYPEENICSLIKVDEQRCAADYDHPHNVDLDREIKPSLTFHSFMLGARNTDIAIKQIEQLNECGY